MKSKESKEIKDALESFINANYIRKCDIIENDEKQDMTEVINVEDADFIATQVGCFYYIEIFIVFFFYEISFYHFFKQPFLKQGCHLTWKNMQKPGTRQFRHKKPGRTKNLRYFEKNLGKPGILNKKP